VDEVTPRRRIAPTAVIWLLLGAAYFLIPLVSTFILSIRSDQTAKCCTFANYSYILNDPEFWRTIRLSFVVALETIALTLALLVPTVYWVHLKVPRLRPLIGFLALVPFVVAPIILVVGLLDATNTGMVLREPMFSQPSTCLVSLHVLSLIIIPPIDVHMTEASQSSARYSRRRSCA
jgi:ABC-type spermidine/putrescine transport system permease subunit II